MLGWVHISGTPWDSCAHEQVMSSVIGPSATPFKCNSTRELPILGALVEAYFKGVYMLETPSHTIALQRHSRERHNCNLDLQHTLGADSHPCTNINHVMMIGICVLAWWKMKLQRTALLLALGTHVLLAVMLSETYLNTRCWRMCMSDCSDQRFCDNNHGMVHDSAILDVIDA